MLVAGEACRRSSSYCMSFRAKRGISGKHFVRKQGEEVRSLIIFGRQSEEPGKHFVRKQGEETLIPYYVRQQSEETRFLTRSGAKNLLLTCPLRVRFVFASRPGKQTQFPNRQINLPLSKLKECLGSN